MTDTTSTDQGALEGNLLFYGKPEPLSAEQHGTLGVDPVDKPFGFASSSNVVPLTVTEFAPASLSYPVIFVGEARQPMAVMGLRAGENMFVKEDGQFRADSYIPAYVRRYPFVFANDEQQQRLILCFDRAAPFIKEGGSTPLFVDGQPSPYTQQAMDFCNSFEQERLRTQSFVQLLASLDLFDIREATFTPRNPDGSAAPAQKLADYHAVSEDKLKALPAEKLAELRDNGALGQIYAHLTSLLGWDRLVALAVAEQQQSAQASLN